MGCGHPPAATTTPVSKFPEHPEPELVEIVSLPLAGPFSSKKAELSALSWWHEFLVMCPQYPSRIDGANGKGAIGIVAKDEIVARLDHPGAIPTEPRLIPFDDGGVSGKIEGFEGFEAMAIRSDTIVLSIEAKRGAGTLGYLIAGKISLEGVSLDPSTLVELPAPVALPNMGFEALAFANDNTLFAFFEANGSALVATPSVFTSVLENHRLSVVRTKPIDPIEYRVTDVTAPDAHGKMYALNIYWSGEPMLARPGADAAERARGIEQIIELEIRPDRISRTSRPPLRFRPDVSGKSRNWEGIVALPGRGFLVVTDDYPDTRLGFVPWHG